MAQRTENKIYIGHTQFGDLTAIDNGEIGRVDAADEIVLENTTYPATTIRDEATIRAALKELGISRILPGADWQRVRHFCHRLGDYWRFKQSYENDPGATDRCLPNNQLLDLLIKKQTEEGIELDQPRLRQSCAEVELVQLLHQYWRAMPADRPKILETVHQYREALDPSVAPVLTRAVASAIGRETGLLDGAPWLARMQVAVDFCAAAGIPFSLSEQVSNEVAEVRVRMESLVHDDRQNNTSFSELLNKFQHLSILATDFPEQVPLKVLREQIDALLRTHSAAVVEDLVRRIGATDYAPAHGTNNNTTTAFNRAQRTLEAFEASLRACALSFHLDRGAVYQAVIHTALEGLMTQGSIIAVDTMIDSVGQLRQFAQAAGLASFFDGELQRLASLHRSQLLDYFGRHIAYAVSSGSFYSSGESLQGTPVEIVEAIIIRRDTWLAVFAQWGVDTDAITRAALDARIAYRALSKISDLEGNFTLDGLAENLSKGLQRIAIFAERARLHRNPEWQLVYSGTAARIPPAYMALLVKQATYNINNGDPNVAAKTNVLIDAAQRAGLSIDGRVVHTAVLTEAIRTIEQAAREGKGYLLGAYRGLIAYARATDQPVPDATTGAVRTAIVNQSAALREEIVLHAGNILEEALDMPASAQGYAAAVTYIRAALKQLREELQLTRPTEQEIWKELRARFEGRRGLAHAASNAGYLLFKVGLEAMRSFVTRFRRAQAALQVKTVVNPREIIRAVIDRCLEPPDGPDMESVYHALPKNILPMAKDILTIAKEAHVDLRQHPRGEKFLQFVVDQQLAFTQTLGTEGADLAAFEYALAEAITFATQAGIPFTPQRLEQIRMEGLQGCWRYVQRRITNAVNDPQRFYGSLLIAKSFVRVGQTCLERIGQLDPTAVLPLRVALQRLAEEVETALQETAPK